MNHNDNQSINWPAVITALLGCALVLLVLSWGLAQVRASRQRRALEAMWQRTQALTTVTDSGDELTAATGAGTLRREMTIVTPACTLTADSAAQTAAASLLGELESRYQPLAISDDDREEFARFLRAAMAVEQDNCTQLQPCDNVFARNLPFVVAYARQRFGLRHLIYNDDRTISLPSVATDEQLLADIEAEFGVSNFELRTVLPSYEYDPSVGTLSVGQGDPPARGYEFQLESLWGDPTTGKIVFVAPAQREDDCTVTIDDASCTCPEATYYLVTSENPDTGALTLLEELVAVHTASQPVTE